MSGLEHSWPRRDVVASFAELCRAAVQGAGPGMQDIQAVCGPTSGGSQILQGAFGFLLVFAHMGEFTAFDLHARSVVLEKSITKIDACFCMRVEESVACRISCIACACGVILRIYIHPGPRRFVQPLKDARYIVIAIFAVLNVVTGASLLQVWCVVSTLSWLSEPWS